MHTISKIVGRRVQLKGLIGKRAVKCPYCNFYYMKNGSDLQRHIWAHEGKWGVTRTCLSVIAVICLKGGEGNRKAKTWEENLTYSDTNAYNELFLFH